VHKFQTCRTRVQVFGYNARIGGPAALQGSLVPGDKVTHIDGRGVGNMDAMTLSDLIMGAQGAVSVLQVCVGHMTS
jgi:hypothetical protein